MYDFVRAKWHGYIAAVIFFIAMFGILHYIAIQPDWFSYVVYYCVGITASYLSDCVNHTNGW